MFERIYRSGGWLLFTRPALIGLVVLMVAGLGIFGYLIGGRYGTPFVVADKIGVGGLVFLGRALLRRLLSTSARTAWRCRRSGGACTRRG